MPGFPFLLHQPAPSRGSADFFHLPLTHQIFVYTQLKPLKNPPSQRAINENFIIFAPTN